MYDRSFSSLQRFPDWAYPPSKPVMIAASTHAPAAAYFEDSPRTNTHVTLHV